MYRIPKALLPKFLWRPIFEYLLLDNISKLSLVNIMFLDMLSDDNWKQRFQHERNNNIVIVKCNANRMDGFWKHACVNMIACTNFNDMFTTIESDNKINADSGTAIFIYYKVFIKAGKYNASASTGERYNINYTPCSIEINGCKTNPSIINYPNAYHADYLITPLYFSMKYITFHDIFSNLIFRNYYWRTDKHYNENKLCFSNCIFKGIESEWVNMHYFYDIAITNCKFEATGLNIFAVNKLSITDCIFNNSIIRIDNIGYLIKLDYIISDNTFCDLTGDMAVENGFICFGGIYDIPSLFIVKNNIIMNTTILCINNSRFISVMFTNNIISNINSCINRNKIIGEISNTIFENNTFTNVDRLYYSTVVRLHHSKLCSNNIFNNCGAELIQYVE